MIIDRGLVGAKQVLYGELLESGKIYKIELKDEELGRIYLTQTQFDEATPRLVVSLWGMRVELFFSPTRTFALLYPKASTLNLSSLVRLAELRPDQELESGVVLGAMIVPNSEGVLVATPHALARPKNALADYPVSPVKIELQEYNVEAIEVATDMIGIMSYMLSKGVPSINGELLK